MNGYTNITLLSIIGVAVLLLFFSAILASLWLNQRKKLKYQQTVQRMKEEQQNQLIEAAVKSEETERHRIAETLHDEVGAILSSAKLHLLGIKTEGLNEKDQKMYEKGGGLLNDVIKRVRGISHSLHSNILREFGLNEAIRDFLVQVAGGSVIDASTELDEHYLAENPDDDISLYRTLQELVNNIIKYAHAKELVISSKLNSDKLKLTIFHNGDGLTQDQFEKLSFQKEGLELKNIRNRILLLKGKIQFEKDNDGYRIHITVPASKQVAHDAH